MSAESKPVQYSDPLGATDLPAIDASERDFSSLGWQQAPFVVMRSAGLSAEAMQVFEDGLGEALDNRERALEAMDLIANEIEDTFFHTVGELEDRKIRRDALALKRDVHNRRVLSISRSAFDELLLALPEALRCQLKGWYDQQEILAKSLADMEAAEAFVDSPEFAVRFRQTIAGSEPFEKGLSYAAPLLMSRIDSDLAASASLKKRRRAIASVSTFLTRASMKTSPMSFFMQLAFVPVDETAPKSSFDLGSPELQGWSLLNRGIFASLSHALRNCQVSDDAEIMINPTLKFDGFGGATMWSRLYKRRRQQVSREEHLSVLRLGKPIRDLLNASKSTLTVGDLKAAIGSLGVDAAKSDQTFAMLLRKDILRFRQPISIFSKSNIQNYADWARSVYPNSLDTAEAKQFLGAADKVPEFHSEPPLERVKSLGRINSNLGKLRETLDPDDSMDVRTSVIENSRWRSHDAFLGQDGKALIDRALGILRHKLEVSREYLWLRDQFVAKYGVGGRCDDVGSFLEHLFQTYPNNMNNFAEPSRGNNSVSTRGARIAVSGHVQFVRNEHGELQSPIVNAAYQRPIWQISRYTDLEGDNSDPFISGIEQWIRKCAGDAEPVLLQHGAECMPLQTHNRFNCRVLSLDGDKTEGALHLDELVLTHDSSTRLLQFATKQGEPVRLFYVGGASPLPGWGPKYFLIVGSEPFRFAGPQPEMVLASKAQEDMVRYQPRIVEGDCILLRATWFLKSKDFLEAVEGKTFAETAGKIRDFLKQHSIPLQSYVTGQLYDSWRNFSAVGERHRKPMWFDSNSVLSIRNMMRIADQTDMLALREVLPSTEQNTAIIHGKAHTFELHIEALFEG